ncbi:DUF2169 domain-containing protein [Methylobacterium sp. Leaf469]|uniref:DUF2169 family type VI secretion system accessory protein n=1 Tax=Methylobacterium sp. Leaf469 TaxID=1736387 RepID=UPI001AEBBB22|nr:DUF2169 domain-containing protein [Methylobacterium sp. Leaf469]
MAVICARGRYELSVDGAMRLADDQALVLSDVYEGDPQRTPLVRVADLIPYKPEADVTLLGTAYAPKGTPARSWEVALAVADYEVRLRVHGPRAWEPALKFLKPTWKLGAAEPTTTVPLDYRLASGGRVIGDAEGAVDARNPIGLGLLHIEFTRIGKPWRAPQIDSADASVESPFTTPPPQGFGPVPPFWSSRQRRAGTYDEAWQNAPERRLPGDFDYRFYQTAPAALALPHLAGNETVRLDGLVPGGGRVAFTLPGVALVAHHYWFDGRQVSARLALDGVHLDLRRADGPWWVDLTWRSLVAACPAYDGAVLAQVPCGEAANLPTSGAFGLVEPEVVA